MSETQAHCRGCGKLLRGNPYYMGGEAYNMVTGERARRNHYGGYVCSRECDRRASLELESSMPGCMGQKTLTCYAKRSLEDNWGEQ